MVGPDLGVFVCTYVGRFLEAACANQIGVAHVGDLSEQEHCECGAGNLCDRPHAARDG